MGTEWRALSKATCGAPGGHASGRSFLDVCVTVSRRGARFRVTAVETRGYTKGRDDKIYGRCEVVGDSVLLDVALADAVARARKAAVNIHYLTRAIVEARDAAIAILQEEKNGEPAAIWYQADHVDADNGIRITH